MRAGCACRRFATTSPACSIARTSKSLCARFGGDEFAFAFVDTPVADAAARLEEIRRTVSATPMPLRIQAVVYVTCSAGVAVAPLDGRDATTLIDIADSRLLAAKNAGRDRWMIAGSIPDSKSQSPNPKLVRGIWRFRGIQSGGV